MADTPVNPGAGTITLDGPAPSVSLGTVIFGEVGPIALSGPPVTVEVSTNVIILDPGAIALDGPPVDVAQSNFPNPEPGIITLDGPPVDVDQTTSGSPGPGVIALSGPPVSVVQSINRVIILPAQPAIALSGPRVTVGITTGARTVDLNPGVIQLQGPAPTITQSANGVVPGTPADYANLITSEHHNKPRFKAVVELLVSGLTDGMKTLASMPVLYQFNTALGEQLDRVGVWIGLSRFVTVPSLGTVELNDNDYRLLLISKIAANHFDGSFQQYQQILSSLFVGYGFQLIAVDNQDMSIDIYVLGATPTPLQLALMQSGYLPPKPEGVRINGITVIGADPVFGTDHEDGLINGPDFGAFY